eukprot:CAMPEP_0195149402 /NCGR_PEP_ID=MMETSP0448-20130528/177021_1 /TAXON_ID=66468 /ORGANISM="Heterocapsa triquestra, Strain CCMP 448" /LENGTH=85 /DNA_ID=CAMNT_0040188053 /DNA_START=275 /DNA_END=532 /DNA_ORIENTATION=-
MKGQKRAIQPKDCSLSKCGVNKVDDSIARAFQHVLRATHVKQVVGAILHNGSQVCMQTGNRALTTSVAAEVLYDPGRGHLTIGIA